MTEDRRLSNAPDSDPGDTYWDEEWLRQKYHEEEMTMDEIAESIGVSRSTIQNWIDRYDIERHQSEPTQDPELRGWYRVKIDDGLTTNERAKFRNGQRSLLQRLRPLRKERDDALSDFSETRGFDMDDVSERLDAKSAFRETERGKAIDYRLREKRQKVQNALVREYSTFIEERFDSPESESKKKRICVLKRAFGRKADRHAIAEAVDASPGWVGKFLAFDEITIHDSGTFTRHFDDDAHERGETPVILHKERRRTGTLSSKTRNTILERDGNRCLRCGSTDSLQVHHIKPVVQGGNNEKDNLATLCSECHNEAILVGADRQVTAYPRGEFDGWLNDDLDICGARTRNNKRCQNPAGSCPHHG